MKKISKKLRERKNRKNGSHIPGMSYTITEIENCKMVGDGLKFIRTFVAVFCCGGVVERKWSIDLSVCERFVRDQVEKYKRTIKGTMLERRISYLVDEINRCLNNTNAMLEKPMVGYLSGTIGSEEGHEEVLLLGVNNKVIYYRTGDGVEHSCNLVYEDVFDLLDIHTIGRFCDAVSGIY